MIYHQRDDGHRTGQKERKAASRDLRSWHLPICQRRLSDHHYKDHPKGSPLPRETLRRTYRAWRASTKMGWSHQSREKKAHQILRGSSNPLLKDLKPPISIRRSSPFPLTWSASFKIWIECEEDQVDLWCNGVYVSLSSVNNKSEIKVIGSAAGNVSATKNDTLENLGVVILHLDESLVRRIIGRGWGETVRSLEMWISFSFP